MSIRTAQPRDAAAILSIYAYYVENTAVSYEYVPPKEADYQQFIADTLQNYPYLVWQKDGIIHGYAYAHPFNTRKAAEHTCEVSIYVDPLFRGKGIGKALYAALEETLQRMGVNNLYAVIAYPNTEDDPHLTKDSASFHAHMGYQKVGFFHNCGYKFDTWYNLLWMEKILGHEKKPFVPFSALEEAEQ